MSTPPPKKEEPIKFPNGRQAELCNISGIANPVDVLETVGVLPPKAVIVIAGGAGSMGKKLLRRLTPLFSLGIARAAKICEALIIDGGNSFRCDGINGQRGSRTGL